MAQGKKGNGTAIGVGLAGLLALGAWLYNAKLGGGGSETSGDKGPASVVTPTAGSAPTPAKPESKPAPPETKPSITKVTVSIALDPSSNSIRYLIEQEVVEPGKFKEQFGAFVQKNPSLKEVTLRFPPETPAADVIALKDAISSFQGLTYTIAPTSQPSPPPQ